MKISFVRRAAPCTHVIIQTRGGEVLFITDQETLLTPPQEGDHPVMVGLKQMILNTNTALGVDFSVMKTSAELREF